jgi:PAS domain S-box-containing protein/diguanylate cyclase (GGDEF)-like protein
LGEDTAGHRVAAIVRAAQDAIFEVDQGGRITLWNPAAERLFGYAECEAVGMPLARLVPSDRHEEMDRVRDAARSGDVPAPFETMRRARDGTLVPVSVVVSPLHTPAGSPTSAAVVVRDLRPLASTRAELAASEARFRALVERAGDLYLICSPDGVMTYVSPRAATPGGRRPRDLVGQSVFAMAHEDDRPFARAAFAAFVATPGVHEPVLVRGYDVDGATRWYELAATNLVDDPAVGGVVVIVRDVTEQQALREELAQYAREDRLTGLPTRAALADELAALRKQCPGPTALVVVEVEGVVAVRREAGHLAGDAVRRAVADRLRAAAADGDVVARLGGETFAVLRAGVSGAQAARRLAEDMAGAAGEPVDVHGRLWPLATSAGVAVSADDDAETLVRDADLARYEAKAHSARVEVFAPALRRAAAQRTKLVRTLLRGLSEDALRLEFQPAVRLEDGVVVGAEALVRWHSPEHGELPPETFLAAATASGLLPSVGEWVLRHACAAAAAWPGEPYVAVNVWPRELESEAFPAAVTNALALSGLPPHRLVLELAERAVPALDGPLANVLAELAGGGVRVAFDGAGAASVVYLKRLPVSMLKIGREFVAGLGANDDDDAIVASLLNLASAVGIDAVAVGVERPGQRALLAQLGCAVAQGFLLGRPAAEPPWAPVPGEHVARPRRAARAAVALDPVVVARMRSLMREGASLYTIAAALNAEHLTHPEERRWHPRAVAHAIAVTAELSGPRERWSVL